MTTLAWTFLLAFLITALLLAVALAAYDDRLAEIRRLRAMIHPSTRRVGR